MALALACWRIAADLNWTGSFAISSGLFSHWQAWLAAASLQFVRADLEPLRRNGDAAAREARIAFRYSKATQGPAKPIFYNTGCPQLLILFVYSEGRQVVDYRQHGGVRAAVPGRERAAGSMLMLLALAGLGGAQVSVLHLAALHLHVPARQHPAPAVQHAGVVDVRHADRTGLGNAAFLKFYFFCGIAAGVCDVTFHAILGDWETSTIGASGAIYGPDGGLWRAVPGGSRADVLLSR